MITYLPGLSPVTFHGNLKIYDHIVISISGGKDSHAMLFLLRDMAEKQGVLDRIVCTYMDTGMEWHNADAHVRYLCGVAGVRVVVLKHKRGLLDEFISRSDKNYGKRCFPSPSCRYCTSNFKVDPHDKHIRTLRGNILCCTGERRQESLTRAGYADFYRYEKLTLQNGTRNVDFWRPVLDYQLADIWAVIKDSGAKRHEAYDLGAKRLGCAGCIFSSDRDLKIEMENNQEIFHKLDKIEADSGSTMAVGKGRIRDRIRMA
jgi:3'-phosphoadenosine 5'-phosphosulfate sulfotransferase (PAPS reductase)/FAD synthetase